MSIVTVISVAAVGYETVTVQSMAGDLNSSNTLWYEKLFPTSQWIPSSKECEASRIKIRDCTVLCNLPKANL